MMSGGDLAFHLKKSTSGGLKPDAVKYYLASVVLGLEALHGAGFVYRDLKDQNVLLDAEGKARLADFGLAADISKGPVSGRDGTRGFISPEQYAKEAYTTSPDLWALGVCAYHWATGRGPFASQTKDKKETEKLVLAVSYDKHDGPEKAIVDSLLVKEVKERGGCGAGGIAALKTHAYFSGLEWEKLATGDLTPPIKPGKECLNAPSAKEIDSESFNKHKKKKPSAEAEDAFKGWPTVNTLATEAAAIAHLEGGGTFSGKKGGGRRRSSNLASLADVNTQKTLFQIQEEGDGGARRGSVGGGGPTEVKGGGGGCCIIA